MHLGSAVCEIFGYKQTEIILLYITVIYNFRDQLDSKLIQQEQASPRLADQNPVCTSVNVCVQTSLPDLTIPAANLDTCHSCHQTAKAKILQKNMTTTGYLFFI